MLSQVRIITKKFIRNHSISSCAASEKSIFKMNYHKEKAKQENKTELSEEHLASFVLCDNITPDKSDKKKDDDDYLMYSLFYYEPI